MRTFSYKERTKIIKIGVKLDPVLAIFFYSDFTKFLLLQKKEFDFFLYVIKFREIAKGKSKILDPLLDAAGI